MVNELNAAQRLILKHFCLVIGILMHIPGSIGYLCPNQIFPQI